MMTQLTSLLIGLALSFAAAGCSNPSNAAPGAASASTANAPLAASTSPAATKVTKIVFVGKQNACDCTRRTIDAGWAALQKALGTPAKLPVERLQIDTEGEMVAPYRKQKPMMALPAIYFVDGKNVVLELLQGEVSEAQIAAALGK
ncbi:MAG: hypothetical protein GYA21_15340 [Myxococcales bacterium]|nr:hypothetical protein [Myxococcales bacterium]